MAAQTNACPICQELMLAIDYRENRGFDKWYCTKCDLCVKQSSITRRRPSKATAEMIRWAEASLPKYAPLAASDARILYNFVEEWRRK